MIICFLNIQNSLELNVTKGHITFNEPIPYWGLHGLAIWMMFVNDYMLFWMSKTTLSWLIQKVVLLSMNLSHMRAPWPSYIYDVCKWLYAFLNIKNNLKLTDTKGHIAFNQPIPYWGLHGLTIWMMFVNDYMLLQMSKQPWVDWYKSSHCFQWTYPILRAPWPSYMSDICKWLYAFWISKTALSWLIQKVILILMNQSNIGGSMA